MLPIIKESKEVSNKLPRSKSRGFKQGSNKGFTLIELLVAIAIVGIISIISIQSLYNAVTIRSKQYSIEDSSDDFRSLIKIITKEVVEGRNIKIPNSHQIMITGDGSCTTVSIEVQTVKYLQVSTPCTPPTVGLTNILGSNFTIDTVKSYFSPVSDPARVVSIYIEGVYKNSLGEHPFKYQTTVTPRISI